MKSKTILGADGTTEMRENYSRDTWERRRGRNKGSTADCGYGKQLKAVQNAAGSIRQIFTDYGVLQMLY